MVQGQPTPEVNRTTRRLPGLDIVRGIAAGAVFVSHSILACTVWNAAWCASASERLTQVLGNAMQSAGAWGVGLFFILSGACIHLPMARQLAADENASLNLRAYFARRFTRIYPPHIVALVLSIGAAVVLARHAVAMPLLSVPTPTQVVAHVLMIHNYLPGALFSISSVLWTIALETQFYVLYPLVLIARRRFGLLAITIALLALSVVIRLVAKQYFSADVQTLLDQSVTRHFWEWVLGVYVAERIVARAKAGEVPIWTTVVFMLASYALGVGLSSIAAGGALRVYLWPMLFACIVELASRRRHVTGRLGERAMLLLGHVSYSLYLFHPIVLGLVFLAAAGHLDSHPSVTVNIMIVLGTLGSLAFFYAVEQPFMRRAIRIGRATN